MNRNSIDSKKLRLRQRMRTTCQRIPAEDAARAAQGVAQRVIESPEFIRASTVAFYAATRCEIETRQLFEVGRREEKCCLFPRCRGKSGLDFVLVEFWEQLEPGSFGVLEPEAQIAPTRLGPEALVLVPGVAFDTQGGRLGRGGGYYDRAFPADGPPSPFLMGLAHEAQLMEAVPVGVRDRRVDAVVTQSGIVRR